MPERPSSSGAAKRFGQNMRQAIPKGETPELLMPVTDEHALRQFEIEALRQITDNLKRLNDKIDRQDGKLDEQTKDIRSIDARLIRIESNSVNAAVQKLEQEVDSLKAERDRRAGALGFATFLKDFGPWLLAIAMALLALAGWEHK